MLFLIVKYCKMFLKSWLCCMVNLVGDNCNSSSTSFDGFNFNYSRVARMYDVFNVFVCCDCVFLYVLNILCIVIKIFFFLFVYVIVSFC